MQRNATARRRESADTFFASARPIAAGWSDTSGYGGAGANQIGTDLWDEAFRLRMQRPESRELFPRGIPWLARRWDGP